MIDSEKSKYLAEENSSIEEVWTKIDLNRHRSIIIIDNCGRVVGTVSDGDLRKAILAKRLLTTPIKEVMNMNFVVLTNDKKVEAESISQKMNIFLIPIVDNEMNLIDIYAR